MRPKWLDGELGEQSPILRNDELTVGVLPVRYGSREKPLAVVDPEYLEDVGVMAQELGWHEVYVWEILPDKVKHARSFGFTTTDESRPERAIVLAPREDVEGYIKA